MKIEITDEMVRSALVGWNTKKAARGDGKMRAALRAVAPIIADQALEWAAQEFDGGCDIYGDNAARAIRALKEPTP